MFALLLTVGTLGAVGAPLQQARAAQPINPDGWVSADDYPPLALRQGEQGVTTVRLDVDEAGAVAKCVVVGSSGSSTLDTTTCALIIRRARFVPARDADGRAMTSRFNRRISWTLP